MRKHIEAIVGTGIVLLVCAAMVAGMVAASSRDHAPAPHARRR